MPRTPHRRSPRCPPSARMAAQAPRPTRPMTTRRRKQPLHSSIGADVAARWCRAEAAPVQFGGRRGRRGGGRSRSQSVPGARCGRRSRLPSPMAPHHAQNCQHRRLEGPVGEENEGAVCGAGAYLTSHHDESAAWLRWDIGSAAWRKQSRRRGHARAGSRCLSLKRTMCCARPHAAACVALTACCRCSMLGVLAGVHGADRQQTIHHGRIPAQPRGRCFHLAPRLSARASERRRYVGAGATTRDLLRGAPLWLRGAPLWLRRRGSGSDVPHDLHRRQVRALPTSASTTKARQRLLGEG